MKVNIKEPNIKIFEDDISDFEKKFDITLPEDYKNFMLEYNGGFLETNLFNFINLWKQEDAFVVGEFYRLDFIEPDEKSYPTNMIPIALVTGDCELLLSISGEDRGKVYHWEFEAAPIDEEPDYSNLTLLANTFDEFMNSFVYPYDSEFIEYCIKGEFKKAKKLVEDGLDVNSKDKLGSPIIETVLEYLTEAKNPDDAYDLVKIMVEKGVDVINTLTLTLASRHGEKAIPFVKLFLENNADINQLIGGITWARTPLMSASFSSSPSIELIQFLLEHGADPNILDPQDKKASDYAKEKMESPYTQPEQKEIHKEIYEILLEAEKKQGSEN